MARNLFYLNGQTVSARQAGHLAWNSCFEPSASVIEAFRTLAKNETSKQIFLNDRKVFLLRTLIASYLAGAALDQLRMRYISNEEILNDVFDGLLEAITNFCQPLPEMEMHFLRKLIWGRVTDYSTDFYRTRRESEDLKRVHLPKGIYPTQRFFEDCDNYIEKNALDMADPLHLLFYVNSIESGYVAIVNFFNEHLTPV
ncbi:hypothetical protein [Chitinilyticum aquatile]|uniref:hypothetical protein n=1 Tax=Chitinilyticum aquatile TaxID=362520 RepID=UPI0012DEC906|nr:hypothetical protein [Chitinilyticum aquatile]